MPISFNALNVQQNTRECVCSQCRRAFERFSVVISIYSDPNTIALCASYNHSVWSLGIIEHGTNLVWIDFNARLQNIVFHNSKPDQYVFGVFRCGSEEIGAGNRYGKNAGERVISVSIVQKDPVISDDMLWPELPEVSVKVSRERYFCRCLPSWKHGEHFPNVSLWTKIILHYIFVK